MKSKLKFILFIFFIQTELSCCWDEKFIYGPCYEQAMDLKMPVSIDNFIAIVENFERENSNTSPQNIASAILNRYRTNGVSYNPREEDWSITDSKENYKQKLDDKLIKPSIIVPEDTFTLREECALHMTVSHSTDFYSHAGVDDMWDNKNYGNGKNYKRKKRASSYSKSFSVDETDVADHPIEFGVIQTMSGPVATGLVLAGILASDTDRSYTVGDLIGSSYDKDDYPSEMLTQKISPLYGATISGEIAQAALFYEGKKDSSTIGSIGIFGNYSACPRLFSRQNKKKSFLLRSEIFGGLDGFIIGNYLQKSSSSQSIMLSEILRMYYGNHGLFNQDIRSCNRKAIYNKFQKTVASKIRDEALSYMYAYQSYFPNRNDKVLQNGQDFEKTEKEYSDLLDPVFDDFDSFMSSYSYDDPDYYPCPKSILKNNNNNNNDNIQYETQVDLVVVYSPTGSTAEVENQQQYIGLTARRVGVGYHRSRIAVLNGRTEKWLAPMTNYSNIADYVCNYTTFTELSGGSSQDFVEIIDKLTKFYHTYYSYLRNDSDRTGQNSQVVLWNLPNSFDGNEEDMQRAWNTFNWTYPDVTFIFAGPKNTIQPLYDDDNKDELIFVSTTSLNPIEISNQIFLQIQQTPRMFLYAACNTLNTNYENYNELSHVYTTYVSPNYTTLIRIMPQNFRFSERVELYIKNNNVRVCISRVNAKPEENTDDTTCDDAPFTYEQKYLCDRDITQCNPIYISVYGKSDKTKDCSDEFCVYPNQIPFEMTHEGMVCAACNLRPTHFALLIFLTFIFFRT